VLPRPDPTSLVAGIALLALGVLLLLDANGTLDLRFAVLAPVACAAMGAILLASGMTRPR
jgi:energy-converting hydrogenase Eha subunit C